MKAVDFLSTVVPNDGYLIAATPFQPPGAVRPLWQHVVVDDVPALITRCLSWMQDGKDVFYALASFEQRQVWNPNKEDWRTKQKGAYEKRTQANVKYVRSIWIDLDVGLTKAYPTQADGLRALRAFCQATGLPRPMVVSSGFGLHVYWPFVTQLVRADWQPIANRLRDAVLAFDLKCDSQCTADAARVLRLPESRNFKQGSPGMPVQVVMESGAYDVALLDATLTQCLVGANVPVTARKPRASIPGVQVPMPGVAGNLTHSGPPLNPDTLVWECANFARQAADRGAGASEPEWYLALGLAQFCADPRTVALSVSDAHPGFNPAYMDQKRAQWTGPPTCLTISKVKANEATCLGCRHWGKIKSPATIGREIQEAPALPQVVIPELPKPYKRITQKNGSTVIGIVSENDEGVPETHVICPFELYPKRILRQTGEHSVEEHTVWVANLPRLGDVEIKLPQGILSDTRKLHNELLTQGAYLNANEAKTTSTFMHAYLQQLSRTVERERMYERLGWHEDYHQFVTPTAIYTRGGLVLPHVPNKTIQAFTQSMLPMGSKERWLQEVAAMYGGPGNEHNRMLGAFAFGAPLLHMLGHNGILVTASGDTGRGKTTVLEMCASIFGRPGALVIGGGRQGSTINGIFLALSTLHSYPMFWDDTTDRDPEEMREFMIHISQGRDKIRMSGHEHDGHMRTWGTIVISSANTDDMHRILATGKDSNPHLMRLLSVTFGPVDTSPQAKIRADNFRQAMRENHGHVGAPYMQHITKNYLLVHSRLKKVLASLDTSENVEASERFWSAGVASAMLGGYTAYKEGLWPFDPFADEEWAKQHITKMRANQVQSASTSVDILNEFLDNNIGRSLIIQAKGTSNLDNVASRAYQELWIRREMDNDLIYVSRAAFIGYCNQVKAHFSKVQEELAGLGIITNTSYPKALGAGTPFAVGQVRCWEISMVKLRDHKGKK